MQLKNYSLMIGNKVLFSNVNVNFQKGSICHLLGGNGVGKSCFAKSLMNAFDYKGEVIYNGDICVIGSYTNIPHDLTINDLIKILKVNKVSSTFNELYELLRIEEIDNKLKIGKMSDGQKQKIKLLVFLTNNPEIIVLDEFTTSLDKKSMLDSYVFFEQYIRKKEVLIINITHNILDLENLDGKYYYVTQQKIIQYNNKKDLLNDYTNLK